MTLELLCCECMMDVYSLDIYCSIVLYTDTTAQLLHLSLYQYFTSEEIVYFYKPLNTDHVLYKNL